MKILSFDKPQKKLSLTEWKREQYPEHPSYGPNMSEEDSYRWRATLEPKACRVTVRKNLQPLPWRGCCTIKLVVQAEHVQPKEKWDGTVVHNDVPFTVSISMNAKAMLTESEWRELLQAVEEAKDCIYSAKEDKDGRISV